MGGLRCTYRNCSLRTDGKTHMFHYPVFDKVRCHQWLTNAYKLEFLNLKVSQLKNRVVCQHHFKDDNFMNFKKDKLTFDAVPTEDGPYCDSSQLNKTKIDQEESKFSISLDDIENEYLTMIDKKANFSVKYGNFLTNCDLMDLDSLNSLNQINDDNQIAIKGLCELAENPIVPEKDLIPSKKSVKRVQPITRRNRGKHFGNSSHTSKKTLQKKNITIQGNPVVNHDNTIDISRLIQTPQTKDNQNSLKLTHRNRGKHFGNSSRTSKKTLQKKNIKIQGNPVVNLDNTIDISRLIQTPQTKDNQNSLNLILNVSHVPIEFESTKSNDNNQENIDQSIDVNVPDQSKLINDQLFDVKAFDEPKLLNDQFFSVKLLNETKPSNNNDGRSYLKKNKKIRIISEKKISEPVPLIGNFEPVSPTRVLSLPNKKKSFNQNPTVNIAQEASIMNSNTETSLILPDTSKDNIILEKPESEPVRIINSRRDNIPPREIRNDAINIVSNEGLPNKGTEKSRSGEINRSSNKVSSHNSLLRNKIPPERVAAIAEKRKFNMKLRDIIEDCLDKLDEPDKSDIDKRKLLKNTKMQSEKQQVASYLAKDAALPGIQDYTIAYLEARMKKMEDNLLKKIEENSQKIMELKQTVAPPREKKNVHTQVSVSEDVHKKQLYQELSKYLSQEANSLLYEELFINKYTKDVPKDSTAPKRRKRR